MSFYVSTFLVPLVSHTPALRPFGERSFAACAMPVLSCAMPVLYGTEQTNSVKNVGMQRNCTHANIARARMSSEPMGEECLNRKPL
jgi:hypothetical protein